VSDVKTGSAVADSSSLDALLRPRSIVVVGASSDPSKRGYQVIPALRETGFRGDIHLVNPRGGEILGIPVTPTIEALPSGVELALVCRPAPTVPGIIEECAARGVRGAVVLATGFREAGEDGATLEGRLREVIRRTGVRVVGPNTSGILNMRVGLNLIGARAVRPGSVALLLQSGNVALALMTEITERTSAGISVCVGVGNEVDVGFHEVLDWLGRDPDTSVVLMYADGFREPRALLETASRVTCRKPVVLLGAGRTREGATAARSHTGALAGAHEVLAAGLAQAGVTEVRRADELMPVGLALATQTAAEGGGVAILSDGGGYGVVAADALIEGGTRLAELGEATRARLRGILGARAAVGNPVDVGGPADADPTVFVRVAETLAADPEVGAILVIGLFGGYHIRFDPALEEAECSAARGMAEAMRRAGKGIVVHSMYALRRTSPLRTLEGEGVPVIASLDAACTATSALVRRASGRVTWPPPVAVEPSGRLDEADVAAAVRRTRATAASGSSALTEPEARRLLATFGVPLGEAELCASAEEAVAAAERFGGPVAVKVVARGVLHKTEVGGVALDVLGEKEVRQAFDAMRARTPGLEGVLVSPMLPEPVAQVLVGARRDPGLGPVLTLGAGGVAVEILRDVVHRVLPVGPGEVRSMARALKTSPLLLGHRGAPAVDLCALEAAAAGVARCLTEVDVVTEVEVNPLYLYRDGARAVDARVLLEGDS
jgi:acyl-CoA synthetase (NDP forming)